jgi:hypothetical protein
MDTSKLPQKSNNFEDRTGYTAFDNFVNTLLVKLNPVYAYRNVKDAIKYGRPKGPQNMKLDKAASSKNFIDRTTHLVPGYDWKTALFFEAMNSQYKDGVRGDGHYTFEDPRRFQKPLILKR